MTDSAYETGNAVITLALVAAVLAFAAWFQSLVGFGSSVVAAPLLFLIVDRPTAVSALIAVGLVLNTYLSLRISAPLSRRLMLLMLGGAVAGMPAGLWLLVHLPIGPFKVMVGAVAMLLAAVSYRFRVVPLSPRLTVAAGALSGVLQTSTTMSGPPVVLLLSGSPLTRDEVRRTLQTYFLVLGVISLPLFLAAHALDVRGGAVGIACAPLVVAAGYLGNRAARHVPRERFRLLAVVTVMVAGAAGVAGGLHG